ncbi:hypothetical protein [Clostridium baratii]|uniref:hypothetical protein n=1 Tax=Clostridium baratii TaxID=1561 RepID=UPI0005F2918B|nr:hypothetical protein [Clostridium baratii]KJU71532.1 hypothetical protein UC77_08945 [Clostridium baratii]
MKQCFICKTNINDNEILCSSCGATFTEISGENIEEINSMANLTELLKRERDLEPRERYFYHNNSEEYKKLPSEELLQFLNEFKLDSASLGLRVAYAKARATNACSNTLLVNDQPIGSSIYSAVAVVDNSIIMANTDLKKRIKDELDKRNFDY